MNTETKAVEFFDLNMFFDCEGMTDEQLNRLIDHLLIEDAADQHAASAGL